MKEAVSDVGSSVFDNGFQYASDMSLNQTLVHPEQDRGAHILPPVLSEWGGGAVFLALAVELVQTVAIYTKVHAV